jgi:hypothetical protein
MADGQYYGLDEVGTRIWSLLKEPRTLSQIRDILMDEFDVDPEVCSLELKAIVDELADSGLVGVDHKTHAT